MQSAKIEPCAMSFTDSSGRGVTLRKGADDETKAAWLFCFMDDDMDLDSDAADRMQLKGSGDYRCLFGN